MKVLCAGLAVCDVIIKPVTHECIERDTSKAELISLGCGGDAYNVAFNLAALDVPVSLITRVGSDEMGALLLRSMRSGGIGVDEVIRLDMPTSASAVMIRPDGERSFLSYKGACHKLTQEDITDQELDKYDVFFLGSAFDLPEIDNDNLEKLFKRAAGRDRITALDVTNDLNTGHLEILKPVFPYLTLFMPSYQQAFGLTGCEDPKEAACRFREMGCDTVVVKNGAEGCLVLNEDGCVNVPAYPAFPVDTTGAGDAFVSGYIAALVRGMKPIDCARFGNAAGAVCVGKIGASGALESFSQLAEIAGVPM